MGVIEAGDLASRLPHGEAVALIDPEWLVDLLHPYFFSPFAKITRSRNRQTKAFRCFSMNAGTESAGVPVIVSSTSLVPAKIPFW
jgi:hypothetical protein